MKHPNLFIVAVLIASPLACANDSSPTEPTTASTLIIAPKTLSLGVGDSTQIRVAAVDADKTQHLVTSGTWASADDTIATVTNSGVVTGRAAGTANITVTVIEGTATVAVTVSNDAQPVTFLGA